MTTLTKHSFVQEVMDDLHNLNIGTPCIKKKQATSRLRGRVKGKILFLLVSEPASTKWSDDEHSLVF